MQGEVPYIPVRLQLGIYNARVRHKQQLHDWWALQNGIQRRHDLRQRLIVHIVQRLHTQAAVNKHILDEQEQGTPLKHRIEVPSADGKVTLVQALQPLCLSRMRH